MALGVMGILFIVMTILNGNGMKVINSYNDVLGNDTRQQISLKMTEHIFQSHKFCVK